MSDWHGIEIEYASGRREALHIGRLPGRLSLALYLHRGVEVEPLAYFRSEEAAQDALAFLDRLAEAPPARSNALRTDEEAPPQAEVRPGGDRAAQGRSGGREGA